MERGNEYLMIEVSVWIRSSDHPIEFLHMTIWGYLHL